MNGSAEESGKTDRKKKNNCHTGAVQLIRLQQVNEIGRLWPSQAKPSQVTPIVAECLMTSNSVTSAKKRERVHATEETTATTTQHAASRAETIATTTQELAETICIYVTSFPRAFTSR